MKHNVPAKLLLMLEAEQPEKIQKDTNKNKIPIDIYPNFNKIKVESESGPKKTILKKCCEAPAAFRAGLSVEEAKRIYIINCDEIQAKNCAECYQILEKVELYNAQSIAAKNGETSLLKHLGRAVLLQDGKIRLIDPAIGDALFTDLEE